MARESVTLSLNSGCSGRTTSSRQLALRYDYVWFVPSGAVKEDLSHNALSALPIAVPSGEITTGHCMARESVTLSLNSGCSGRTTSLSARQLALRYDYGWFVPSGAVKEDLSHNALSALPIAHVLSNTPRRGAFRRNHHRPLHGAGKCDIVT
jgi:hypothetical protein